MKSLNVLKAVSVVNALADLLKAPDAKPSNRRHAVIAAHRVMVRDLNSPGVYFIQAPDGLIKIGVSKNIATRLNGLQVAHGGSLKFLGALSGDRKLEMALHKKFASLRVQGEWFKPGKCLVEFIRYQVNGVSRSV